MARLDPSRRADGGCVFPTVPAMVLVALLTCGPRPGAALPSFLLRRDGGSGLEVGASDAFFNITSAMEGVAHVPGKVDWAERCLHRCVAACMSSTHHHRASADILASPWLRLMRWDREEDCIYRCCQTCVDGDIRKGGRHWKIRGRWTHVRVLGLREPLSALFSLANLAAHAAGLRLLSAPGADWAHRGRLVGMAWLWMLAWACSAVFHGNGTWLTERLDYYSGNVAMGAMLYAGVCRAGWDRLRLCVPLVRWGVLGAISAALGAHMAMGWERIDYSLNMKVMIGMMLAHSAAWLSVCLASSQPHNLTFYLANGLVYLAGLLEVKDFPPIWGYLDAHSLWHAATPLLSYAFYSFLAADGCVLSPPAPTGKGRRSR